MREYLDGVNFFAIMMDGSTDISGDEQEAIYLRMAKDWKVTEKFLALGFLKCTCASDLNDLILDTLETFGVDKGEKITELNSVQVTLSTRANYILRYSLLGHYQMLYSGFAYCITHTVTLTV